MVESANGMKEGTQREACTDFDLSNKNGIALEQIKTGNDRNIQPNGKHATSDLKPGEIAKNGVVRHFLAILALSAIVMANMNRQAYNQALVRMIRKPRQEQMIESTTSTEPLPRSSETIGDILDSTSPAYVGVMDAILEEDEKRNSRPDKLETERPVDEEDGFDWTGSQISLLQAGFSYGYTLFMIPGGRLSEIYGSKWVIFVSGFGSALCSILTPFIASQSYALLVASRVLMGLCQTGVSPALYAFCTRWLPPDESSVYLPLIKVGVMIGFMLGSLINGFLPWRVMFYVVGTAGFLWSFLWACLAASEPHEQKLLSKMELAYIEQSLNKQRALERKSIDCGKRTSKASAPWWGIMTNPVVVAFTLTKFTVKLSTDTQTMQLPMYMRNVFQVADSLNGVLNGANFAIQACFTGLVAYVAKEMVLRKPFGMTKTNVRTLFQGINNFGMALGYLLISFNMGSLELVCCAVIILSIASMFGSGGEAVLPVDLTTEYAASIMAIANSFANMSGIVMPPIVSFLLANQLTSSTRWNHVWWFVSGTMCCGGLMFTFFVKAESQDFRGKGREGKSAKAEVDRSLDSQVAINLDAIDKQTSWDTRL